MSQDKYTKSARGKPCQVRIIGICSHDPATTVFAHINGAGIGRKASSIHGAYCCAKCHDALDHRVNTQIDERDLMLDFYAGVIRTQEIMIREGVLRL